MAEDCTVKETKWQFQLFINAVLSKGETTQEAIIIKMKSTNFTREEQG